MKKDGSIEILEEWRIVHNNLDILSKALSINAKSESIFLNHQKNRIERIIDELLKQME